MPNSLRRNLNLCFSKQKPTPPNPSPPARKNCPKTTHSTENTNSFLFKNFNSLYNSTTTEEFSDDSEFPLDFTSKSGSHSSDFSSGSGSFSEIPAGLSSLLASRRFFFSPGRSNSIVEEARCSSESKVESPENLQDCPPPPPPEEVVAVDGGVAIPTYSPDPYMDFRQSMQEMVEARDLDDKVDWAYLQDLLFCYLKLNREPTHKFIVGAFGDLLMNLMTSSQETDISGQYTISR